MQRNLADLCKGLEHVSQKEPKLHSPLNTEIYQQAEQQHMQNCRRHPSTEERKHRARLIVDGDQVNSPYEVSTKTVSLDTTKMFLNLVISTPNVWFMTMDIKDFYLGTPLQRYEYIRLQYDIIQNEIKEQYDLHAFKHGDYVYFEIR